MLRYKYIILLGLIFASHLFFRFYNLERWAPYGWDQVDNAWVSAKMLLLHKFPLLGMVAKQNTGMFIGPLYYYIIALVYFCTGLDPIASPIMAGITSLFSFWAVLFVARSLFGKPVALMSAFIYTTSSFIIATDRVQWPVNFLPGFSLLIFYCLYKVISGNLKYFIWLGLLVGGAFHLHFTAIFYPIMISFAMPFLLKTKKAGKYFLLFILITFLFFIPHILYYFRQDGRSLTRYSTYLAEYNHGFHLRRFFQISHDAFIEFEAIMNVPFKILRPFVFLWIPALFLTLKNKKILYLSAIWIVVPWILFSMYRGEISNYYFSGQLFIAVIIMAYLTVWLWQKKLNFVRILLIVFWVYWAETNIAHFLETNQGSLSKSRQYAEESVKVSRPIPFTDGDPLSYLYFYYSYKLKSYLPYQL